jgi:predicted secreted hydrolase
MALQSCILRKKLRISSLCAFVALFLTLTLAHPGRGRGEGEQLTSGFTYQLALPGRMLTFPADHYSHPDFKTEWWYYTGHLETEAGRRYGYQVTFFRFGVRDRQKDLKEKPLFTELYMAHFALSDIAAKKFLYRERINRGIAGKAGGRDYGDKAGAATDRYLVWNEDWKVEGDAKDHRISVSDRGTTLQLSLRTLKAPVLHGQNGHSQKAEGEGRASYYYSLTRMQTEGELTIGGRKEKVRGLSWMDHEFGSNQLADNQVGWDWFSIQLDNQTELMLYLMRRKDGSVDPYSSGTLVTANGETKHLVLKDFRIEVLDRWKSAKSGANYPVKWKVSIPAEKIELQIDPAFFDQELITNRSTRVTYWEGAVSIKGTFINKQVAGNGYVEMTGYAGKLTF